MAGKATMPQATAAWVRPLSRLSTTGTLYSSSHHIAADLERQQLRPAQLWYLHAVACTMQQQQVPGHHWRCVLTYHVKPLVSATKTVSIHCSSQAYSSAKVNPGTDSWGYWLAVSPLLNTLSCWLNWLMVSCKGHWKLAVFLCIILGFRV